MTGKLIKYEMRSSIRMIGIIWVALLGMSLIFGFARPVLDAWMESNQFLRLLLQVVPSFIYFGVLVATIVLTIMIVVQRFYRGMLGDEGYMLHTLPVKTGQLIVSKAFSSTVVIIISGIVASASILSLLGADNLGAFFRALMDAFREAGQYPMIYLILAEAAVLAVISLVSDVYHIYAAMAVGQLSGKYRILTSIGAYLGIGTIITIITVTIGNWGIDSNLVRQLNHISSANEGLGIIRNTLLVLMALTLIKVVVLHIVTERILTKKLNLL